MNDEITIPMGDGKRQRAIRRKGEDGRMTAKRILLAVAGVLAASALALVGLAGVANTTQAQASLKPSNVSVVNGPNSGEAQVSWDAVSGAAYYRIGWVSFPNYIAVTAAGRDWQEAFYFVDLKERRANVVHRIPPGAGSAAFLPGRRATAASMGNRSGLTCNR